MGNISRTGILLTTSAMLLTACTITSEAPPPQSQTSGSSPVSGHADIVEQVRPSVVTVQTGQGIGSGVVLRSNIIVTNEHMVSGVRDVTVAYADGTRSAGTVQATDVVTDVAVVRTERTGLPVPEFRTELPRPGEIALAIGSPLGFRDSVTAGIISGLHRDIPGSVAQTKSLVDLIQTDAPISPGNSGGALLDGEGRVVGLNEAYLPPRTGAVSLGFAIPAATVLDVADQLLTNGTAEHPYLGVSVGPLTGSIREQLGVRADGGAVVLDVDRSGPAATAGIAPGDVIVEFTGSQVRDVGGLLTALRQTEPGQKVPLVLVRNANRQTVELTVGSRSAGQ